VRKYELLRAVTLVFTRLWEGKATNPTASRTSARGASVGGGDSFLQAFSWLDEQGKIAADGGRTMSGS